MREEIIIAGLLLVIASAAATTTTQISKTDVLKGEWNRTICIALHIVQMLSVGIAALLIMIAGLKYMSSEDADERGDARNLVVRVLAILVVIAVGVQVVNYLVAGSDIGSFDMGSCDDLFPTTTRLVPTTSPTTSGTTTTMPGNGTTTSTTSVSTTSSTSTTLGGSCTDPGYKYSIYGSSNACQRATSVDMCNTDFFPNGGNDITDLDETLGVGFSQCCCSNGYPKCCGMRKIA